MINLIASSAAICFDVLICLKNRKFECFYERFFNRFFRFFGLKIRIIFVSVHAWKNVRLHVPDGVLQKECTPNRLHLR